MGLFTGIFRSRDKPQNRTAGSNYTFYMGGTTSGKVTNEMVIVADNFTEVENGVACELRSSRYNINPVAVKYGGGGHQKASGATVASKEIAMQMLADLNEMAKEA
jgi:nanoRNase/pAp phosphatase (c-di-AMP/oligoRNAs hydrolase)